MLTYDDVDWLLRYPADELVMSAETLTQIGNALSGQNHPSGGVRYTQGLDDTGRVLRTASTLADRKLLIREGHATGWVGVRHKGRQTAAVLFTESWLAGGAESTALQQTIGQIIFASAAAAGLDSER